MRFRKYGPYSLPLHAFFWGNIPHSHCEMASPTSNAPLYTLYFLTGFYALLGGMELLAPSRACREGLAGPLTAAGATPDFMCSAIEANPAANLIFFGLAKYHVLFAAINAHALVRGDAAHRRAVLGLSALNFAADDAWAAVHLHWISAGPVVLLPQAALVAWLVWLAVKSR